MMKIFFVAAILLISVGAEIEDEESNEKFDWKELILELTNENFHDALKNHQRLVIFFYTTNCHHCREELAEYIAAVKVLRDIDLHIKFSAIHAAHNQEVVDSLNIKRYPSIRMVENGDFTNSVEYKYVGQKDMNVLNWLTKILLPVRRIDDLDQLNKMIQKRPMPVAFFRDATSPEAVTYHIVAKNDADNTYGSVTNEALFKEYNIEGNSKLLFFRPDGSYDVYDGPWASKSVRVFVDAYSLPVVVTLSPETLPLLHRTALRRQVILFASKSAPNFDAHYAVFESLAQHYRGRLVFIFDDIDLTANEDQLREFFGIKATDTYEVRIALNVNDKPERFRPATAGPLDAEQFTRFIEDALEQRISPYLLAEPLPEDWNSGTVKTLVASNFRRYVTNESRAVLVLLTSTWCSSCEALESIFREVADHFKDRDDVRIARMDRTQNDVVGMHLRHSTPSVLLYPKNEREPIEYFGDKSFDAVKVFVESNGKEIIRTRRRARDEL